MATIILTSYMVRHPLGGVLASNLQIIWGLSRLGHDVYVFEPAGYSKSCFDPIRYESTDDCSYGFAVVEKAFKQMGAENRLCFVDADGTYHGLSRSKFLQVFANCDLFIDRGDHRVWQDESAQVPVRVLLDPDPGYRQIKLFDEANKGITVPDYDAYYTYGYNIATGTSPAPSGGVQWRHIFHPVDTTRIVPAPIPRDAPFTTVMNWTSHKPVMFEGVSYGMKDVEFENYIDLPARTEAKLELAVEGKHVPYERLETNGWKVRNAIGVTATLESYLDYIRMSAGEFSVLKEVYRALQVGWFSDRSAAYLSMARPVVVQDNGLEGVLPSGRGLFSVRTLDEAADAFDKIFTDPKMHSIAAREIAVEFLDTSKVLGYWLQELGISEA